MFLKIRHTEPMKIIKSRLTVKYSHSEVMVRKDNVLKDSHTEFMEIIESCPKGLSF